MYPWLLQDASEHTSWFASVITDNSGLAARSGTNFAGPD
jgi:hypothetical protein